MGSTAAPTLHGYLSLLRELSGECGAARLNPSERRALIAILELAAASPAFRPERSLAVPTEAGAVASLGDCVVNDAPWLLRRLRPGAVELASAALPADLRERLGLRALSVAVDEQLAAGFTPAVVADDDASALTRRVRTRDFAAAASAALVQEASRREGASLGPPPSLSADAIAAAFAEITVVLVASLRTRLALLPSDEDVTAAGAEAEEVLWHVDGTRVLIVAAPPAALSREELLHFALCDVLRCPPAASLAPLLAAPPADLDAAVAHLRIAPSPLRWAAAQQSAEPGVAVSAADESLLQLRPSARTRPARSSPSDSAAPPARSRTPPSTRGSTAAARRASSRSACASARAAASCRCSRSTCTRSPPPASPPPRTPPRRPWARPRSRRRHRRRRRRLARRAPAAAAAGLRASELVGAVRSVLAQAGVPLSLEAAQLVEQNVTLKEDLKVANESLHLANEECRRASEALEEYKESFTCQICYNNRVDSLLIGCGHLLCDRCARSVGGRCPSAGASSTRSRGSTGIRVESSK